MLTYPHTPHPPFTREIFYHVGTTKSSDVFEYVYVQTPSSSLSLSLFAFPRCRLLYLSSLFTRTPVLRPHPPPARHLLTQLLLHPTLFEGPKRCRTTSQTTSPAPCAAGLVTHHGTSVTRSVLCFNCGCLCLYARCVCETSFAPLFSRLLTIPCCCCAACNVMAAVADVGARLPGHAPTPTPTPTLTVGTTSGNGGQMQPVVQACHPPQPSRRHRQHQQHCLAGTQPSSARTSTYQATTLASSHPARSLNARLPAAHSRAASAFSSSMPPTLAMAVFAR